MDNENCLHELLDVYLNLLRSKEVDSSEEEQMFLNRLFSLKRKVSVEIKYLKEGDPSRSIGKVLLENITTEIKKEIFYNTMAFAEYREAGEEIILIKGNENAMDALLRQAEMLGIKWKNLDFQDRIMDMRN